MPVSGVGALNFKVDQDDKGRCGPKFNAKMCTGGNFCNEANGWCGDTDAHRDAQESTMYDGASIKADTTMPVSGVGALNFKVDQDDKGRCGPKFNAKMCTGGNFCNEANVWC